MRYDVTVTAEGQSQLSLPNGQLVSTGDTTTLTVEQYAKLTPGARDLLGVEVFPPDPEEDPE